jgi:hypothetical protein
MKPSRIFDGKKFMWDGVERADGREAEDAAARHGSAGFETRVVLEGGKGWVYTRRVVTEIKLEGAPPV